MNDGSRCTMEPAAMAEEKARTVVSGQMVSIQRFFEQGLHHPKDRIIQYPGAIFVFITTLKSAVLASELDFRRECVTHIELG